MMLQKDPAALRGEKLYEGKAKALFSTPDPSIMLMEFKDDATAFDGKKKGTIVEKGYFNAHISAILNRYLEQNGIHTHFLGQLSDRYHLVRHMDMFGLEVVVRNIAAGSLARRLGMDEGTLLEKPVLEHFLKADELGDPWINAYHVDAMGLCTPDQLAIMESLALKINRLLTDHLETIGLTLVDYKLEFGVDPDGNVRLGDEITPDTCRFWDSTSGDKLDKDRFRQDMGGVEDAYAEVLRRLTTGQS